MTQLTKEFPKKVGLIAIAISLFFGLSACNTIPVEQRENTRREISEKASITLTRLQQQHPGLEEALQESSGYFIGAVSAAMAPLIGGGLGLGELIDNNNDAIDYMNIQHIDLGIGLAAERYGVLMLFHTPEALEKFRQGQWISGLAASSRAGASGGEISASVVTDTSTYMLPESGGSIAVSARVFKVSVNPELTDTGLSEVSIPNTRFSSADRQSEDAPRKWHRKLPFLAQQVIDEGYDLPLPYGFGLTYAGVSQDMELGQLSVGINGSDEEPFEFVAFEDASANSDSAQFIADAWVFPFMQVFAMMGKLEGEAPMDVLLDGNGMLEQMDVNCSGPVKPPSCRLLQDRLITLPIEAKFSGKTYGLGTVLAGGWSNYFVVLPFTFTYADMDGTNTDGAAYTATPRFGRVFNMGDKGSVALFAGGNYLKADLTVNGQVRVPGSDITIDYTIDQNNTDRWNGVLGGNWDLSKHWSLSMEYNGFTGSREAFIASMRYRF